MMNKKVSWILGGLTLIILVSGILFYPLPILSYRELLFIPFLKRAFFILLLSCFLCLYRLIKGPTCLDRAITLNKLGILIVGFCAIMSISTGRNWYIDIAIAWVLQSFIVAVAFAKFLEGKSFDD
jgi:multicomponent Na+:H+ antiporter subunit F